MKRNYNYWSNNTGNAGKVQKVEAPKTRYSVCIKSSLVGLYQEDVDGTVDYFDESSIGCLEVLMNFLETVPDNTEQILDTVAVVYVPTIISALVTGGIADYIRTGKTKSGDIIDQDKLDLYIAVDSMIREKSYNVIVRSYDFQPKDFSAKAIAWMDDKVRSATAKASGKERKSGAVTSTGNSAIDKLNAQIVQLVSEGKFEQAQQIANIIASMSAPKVEENKDDDLGQSVEMA